jgi:hypothetical protein
VVGLINHLPGVFKFDFWGIELLNDEMFNSLRLPAGGQITVSRNETKSISIRLLDGMK